MSSDCFGLLLKLSFYLFYFLLVNICETQNKSQHRPVSLVRLRVYRFPGGFLLDVCLKCNQIVTMSAKRFSFLFVFFLDSLSFFNNSSQAFFLATLTDSEREIFYFVSWNVGHWFLFIFLEGTARLFINVSMVFSLHLITRSQKSTKMDEFELSGCTKLRYLHDWCCLALLSSFIWLFIFRF